MWTIADKSRFIIDKEKQVKSYVEIKSKDNRAENLLNQVNNNNNKKKPFTIYLLNLHSIHLVHLLLSRLDLLARHMTVLQC